MPYRLISDGKTWTLRLRPHNALAPRGFVLAIGFFAGALALPAALCTAPPPVSGLNAGRIAPNSDEAIDRRILIMQCIVRSRMISAARMAGSTERGGN